MSYCRWSSDDYQCDVYVYEDCSGGWTTHVAGRRYVIDRSLLGSPVPFNDGERWFARYQLLTDLIEAAPMEEIELPHAGESFNDGSASECADRLEALRSLGFHVPQYAIDELRAEA